MKTYIVKFYDRKTLRKYAVRVKAYSMIDAMKMTRDYIQKLLGGYVISVAACPLQEV